MSNPPGIPHTSRFFCVECMDLIVGGRGAPQHASLVANGQRQVLDSRGLVAEAYDVYVCQSCGARWRREVLPEEIAGEWRMESGN